MDIEINEVHEIIKNLEGGGELSIKEEKYLNVAKLCVQLTAENGVMDAFVNEMLSIAWRGCYVDWWTIHDLALKHGLIQQEAYCADVHENLVEDPGDFEDGDDVYFRVKTPAIDRILAGIKADGVEEFSKTLEGAADICGKSKAWEAQENLLDFAERGFAFAKQLREGANHD